MTSLVMLVLMGSTALITPLLPLQPPDRVLTKRQYDPPTLWPLATDDFAWDPAAVARAAAEADQLEQELEELELASKDSERLEARDRKRAEARDARLAPYLRAGFAELGPVSRAMVRWRYALFGSLQINSLCGRDLLGRDVLSRILWGARISLAVGLVATLVSLAIGVLYGAAAGFAGGWVDDALMRLVDVLYSIPFIFVAIFLITILNAEENAAWMARHGVSKITVFFAVVGAMSWLTMARVVRGQVISLRTEPFVEAAVALGASRRRIVLRHLLPNLASIVLVYLTLTIPRVMLFEAFLSFLGLGVEPPDVSWGVLAREGIEALSPVRISWWLVLFPSAALGTTLLALNFLGDGLRDAFDPRTVDPRSRRH
jgi:oligopeptide transport system permease protein